MRRNAFMVLMAVVMSVAVVFGGCAAPGEEAGEEAAPSAEGMVIRWCTDHSAAQASGVAEIEVLGPMLEKLLPGSEFQSYHSSSLYKPAETMNQLVLGNLEMGAEDADAAGWDPWCNIWAQPMLLTTVGAHMEFRTTALAKALEEHMADKGIKVLGWECESMLGGCGASERLLTLDDLKGKKIRISATLTQAPMVEAFGGSPVSLAWGDVPSAVQTGVIDAVITSVGGFRQIKDLAPYYTVFGMGGVFTDFYMVMASGKWFDSLEPAHQDAVVEAVDYFLDEFYKMQYAEDILGAAAFGTDDPSKPGIYIATPEEVAPIQAAVGTAIADNLKKELPADTHALIDEYFKEAAELVAKWPPGSHPVEKIDPEDYREMLGLE